MARYSPFSGGPVATDLSGIISQYDSGAVAEGILSASKSIGDALAKRYAQSAQDKKDAKMTDEFVQSDDGQKMLDYLNLDKDSYTNLNNSEKAGLFPRYTKFLSVSSAVSKLEEDKQAKYSKDFLNEASVRLNKPFLGKTAKQNLEELQERMNYISRYDLSPEHRKQLNERGDKLFERISKGLPITEVPTGIKGLFGYRGGGEGPKIINIPKEPDSTHPFGKIVNEYNAVLDKLKIAKKGAKEIGAEDSDLVKSLENDADFYRKKIKKEVTSSGMSFDFGDDGKLIRVSTGGTESTVGSKTKYQTNFTKMKQSLKLLDDVQSLYKDEFVGLEGYLGETLFDKGIAALPTEWAKETADIDRVRFRNKMRLFNNSIMRVIADETRFSDTDRREIKEALVSLKASNSAPVAKEQMENVRHVLITKAMSFYENLKGDEDVDISWLPPSTVIREFNKGNLTEDLATQTLDTQFKNIEGVDAVFLLNERDPEKIIAKFEDTDGKLKINKLKLARLLKVLFPQD